MKKAIILFCIIMCFGCESDQGSSQSVLQIVQTEELKSEIRQLTTTVEAKEAEIEQLKTENANQEILHKEQTTELESQISQLQATIEQQKAEYEKLYVVHQNLENRLKQNEEVQKQLSDRITQDQETIEELIKQIEEQKNEIEQLKTTEHKIETEQPETIEDYNN